MAYLVIYSDFPLHSTEFFTGKHLIHFFADEIQDFRNLVLQNCISFLILNKFI